MPPRARNKVPSRYGRTPHALLEARLGLHANAVFQALAFHDGGGVVCPSLETIGQVADLSVNSVRKAIKVLADSGWVEARELSRRGCRIVVEYRLRYEAPQRAKMSPDDTVTMSPDDTVESPTISPRDTVEPESRHDTAVKPLTMSPRDTVEQSTMANDDVKNTPSTMSPRDSKQELNKNKGTRTAQTPLGLTPPAPPNRGENRAQNPPGPPDDGGECAER